jgi:hypothetical protein
MFPKPRATTATVQTLVTLRHGHGSLEIEWAGTSLNKSMNCGDGFSRDVYRQGWSRLKPLPQ